MYFYGEKEKLKEVEAEIKSHMQDDWFCGKKPDGCDEYSDDDYGFNCMEVSLFENYGDNMTLAGMGRWHGPYSSFKCIIERFGISGEYHDREGGCQFYNRIIGEKGEIIEDGEYGYISKEALEYVGYESMLYDLEWAAEMYEEDPEGNEKYLQEFADIANVTVCEIFEDLGMDVPSRLLGKDGK
jgi:hypothetical protein